MIAKVSLTAFTSPKCVFKSRFYYDVEGLDGEGILAFLEALPVHMVYDAVITCGTKKYYVLSDYAAFLYKRKGQLVLKFNGDIEINRVIYRPLAPSRLRLYDTPSLDAKVVRKQTQLLFSKNSDVIT